jgi:stage IV sporulation protein FB
MGASPDVGAMLIWIGVCFASILVHELGHVVAFRFFGVRAEAVLYGFGGLAVPERDVRGTFARVFVSAAGPVAGFLLAALALGCAICAGAKLLPGLQSVVIPSLSAWIPRAITPYWNVLLNDLLHVNIYWGLVNLLPIYPLDGGHVARALCEKRDGISGIRRSLLVSAITAAVMAVLALITRSMYLVVFFGFLAAGSAQMLEGYKSFFRPRPYDSRR